MRNLTSDISETSKIRNQGNLRILETKGTLPIKGFSRNFVRLPPTTRGMLLHRDHPKVEMPAPMALSPTEVIKAGMRAKVVSWNESSSINRFLGSFL